MLQAFVAFGRLSVGRDRIHTNTASAEFESERFRKTFKCGLHRRVDAEAGAGLVRFDRGDVDDGTAVRHEWGNSANEMSDLCEVFSNKRSFAFWAYVEEWRNKCAAGIVNKHVDMAVCCSDVLDECVDGFGVANIEHCGDHRAAKRLDLRSDVSKKFLLPVADRQGRAAASKEQGGVATDALGCSGHDGDAVGEEDGTFVEKMSHGLTLAHPPNARDCSDGPDLVAARKPAVA